MNIVRYCILLLIFILFGIIAYANIINSFFLSDDFVLIDEISKRGPFSVLANSFEGFFRPLISLSLFIDYKFWKLNHVGYHLTNIIIHSLNSFFVFLISILLINKIRPLKEKRWGLSLLPGFIFLILPCHTEAVAWIAGRTGLIAAFFCLASFWFYLRYREYLKPSYLLTSFLFFMAALFSKESAITFPLIILAYELYYRFTKENNNHASVSTGHLCLIYGLLVALYLAVRYISIGAIIGGYGSEVHLNFSREWIWNNLLLHSARSVLPVMSLEKGFIKLIFIWIIAIVTLDILSIKNKRIHRIFYFFIGSFFITLLPVLNLHVSVADTQGERFLYLPTVFSSLVIGYLFYYLIDTRKNFVISCVILVSVFGGLLYRSNENWRAAGELSNGIVDSIKGVEKSERLFIINLPDNIKGAYIYRNGIREAIHLFINPDKFKDIKVISYNTLYKKTDRVTVTKCPGTPRRRQGMATYTVQLLNPKTFFMHAGVPVENIFKIDYSEMLNFKNNRYDLRFKDLNSNDKVLFYSAGKMETLKVSR